MEDSATKEQSSGKSATRLLRYPLRSASRTKEEKPPVADSINSQSATKRGRPTSSVAKSMGNLDLSGKDKSAKPPRRLSVPSKYNSSTPAPKSLANITPISEAKSKRSAVNQGKSDTPLSDVSKTSITKKFSTISSASYWLTQIKCSESAAKHSISLGFFKLALDAECKPVQKMRDELKAYVRRHNLSELGESIKELFESYKITESYEPSEASGTCSELHPEPNQQSDDDVNSSSSSITDAVKFKTKSLDVNSDEIQQVKQSSDEIQQDKQLSDKIQQDKQSSDKIQQVEQSGDETQQGKQSSKEISNKKDDSAKKSKRSVSKNAATSKPGSEVRGRSLQRKPQKPIKKESSPDNGDKVKKQGKKSAPGKVAGPPSSPPKEVLQDNKENMAEAQEEITAEA